VRFKASTNLLAFVNQPPVEEEKSDNWMTPDQDIEIDILVVPNRVTKLKRLPTDTKGQNRK